MSDLKIPGVNSQYEKLVEALMKKEKIPRDREAQELERYKLQNESWRQMNKLSLELRDIARSLYSFNNPFVEKIVESSNDKALTATASRDAKEQSVKVSVIQTASADSFLSNEISKDLKIEKGKYTFKVGEKEFTVNWGGGSYKNFIDTVNKRGKNVLNVIQIKPSAKSLSLLFSSELTGENNRLEFLDSSLDLAIKLGLIKKDDGTAASPLENSAFAESGTSKRIPFSNLLQAKDDCIMELTVSLEDTAAVPQLDEQNSNNQQSFDSPPIFEQVASVTYEGIIIQNDPSEAGSELTIQQMDIPDESNVRDMNILAVESSSGNLLPLPPISDNSEKQVIKIPLKEFGDIKGLVLKNNNTGLKVNISDIKITRPNVSGGYVPVNPASTAQDAIMTFEGIQVKREKNTIDDLVPGLTFNLHDKTDKEERINVKPNVEIAKNAIIEFTAKYNRLIAEINILTQNQPEIVEELGYFSQEEKENAMKKLGLLHADSGLLSIKSNLRQNISNSYIKQEETPIRMLVQIGVSTKADSSTGVDKARLRGYLEIDEKKLEEALENNIKEVRHLFGYDADGDILIDSGIGYRIFELLDPYVQNGGIFSSRTGGLDMRIKSTERKIEDYDKRLAKKEIELKKKYGVMEGTLKDLQKQSDTISNFQNAQKKRD